MYSTTTSDNLHLKESSGMFEIFFNGGDRLHRVHDHALVPRL
jgi:hypothetical protein